MTVLGKNKWDGYTMYTIVDDTIGGLAQANVNDGETKAFIYNLNIDKAYRGIGWGVDLLRHLEEYVKSEQPQIKTFELSVNCEGYGLLRWYDNLGYKNTNVRIWHEGTQQHRWLLRKYVEQHQ